MHKQVIERFSGIYEINLYQGRYEIHIYLITGKTGQRNLLIDTGYKTQENREIFNQVFEELGIKYHEIDVFLTHKHHDHTGLAAYFQEQGATIFMNPIEDRHRYDCLYYGYGPKSINEQTKVLKLVGVTPERTPMIWNSFQEFNAYYENTKKEEAFKINTFDYTPIECGQLLSYGEYNFKVISLAGHTLGQLGLYEPTHHIVFSADHIIEGLAPIVGTSYVNEHLLQQYFRSLEQFKTQYRTCMIYPSHGNSFSNPTPIAAEIISAYRKKLLQMQHILLNSAKALTIQEIAFRTYGIQTLPNDANRFFKIKSILSKTFSCMEYLYDQNYCNRMEQDGILFYR